MNSNKDAEKAKSWTFDYPQKLRLTHIVCCVVFPTALLIALVVIRVKSGN